MNGVLRFSAGGFVTALLLAIWTGSPQATPRVGSPQLPDGPGKAITERVCVDCHGAENLTDTRATRREWLLTIEDMEGRGAIATAEEFAQIATYLVTEFGRPIKVNEATAKQFEEFLDIPAEKAQAIVDFRSKNGKFKEWKDVLKVPDVDATRVEEQQKNFTFD